MTNRSRFAFTTATAIVIALLSGCAASSTPPPSPTPTGTSDADASEAAAYCADQGGTVEMRQPTFGTNNDPSTWVSLGDPVAVCRFAEGTGDTSTRIYTDLATLASSQPTLAALAYLSKTPMPTGATGNPAAAGCTALGGAVAYGDTANGGGLVLKDDPIFTVVDACVFADGSFIDEWGIAYYSNDVIRGTDLTTHFRFDQSAIPPVFSGGR